MNNTYAFDSLVIIILRTFIDNNIYKKFVDKNSNQFLKFCKALVYGNFTKIIYKDRAKLIINLFNEDNEISGLRVITSECNVIWIVSQLLKELPSVEDQIRCLNKYCIEVNKYIVEQLF